MKKTILLLTIILLLVSLLSLAIGEYTISFDNMMVLLKWIFLDIEPENSKQIELIQNIIIDIRLPRVIAAILIGSAYALSGAALQSMFINPLVSPGILGVLSGSAFGAALAISYFENMFLTQIFSFFFGLIAVGFSIIIAYMYSTKASSTLILVLGGIISGSLFSTLVSILKYVADPYDKLPSIVYWMMGSLASINLDELGYYALIMIPSMMILILLSKYINVLSFGDDEAKSLGIHTTKIRIIVIILATLISALSVSLGGIIGWIGLVMPHIGRLLVGPNNIVLMPTVALLGAIFLIIVDDLARTLFEVEIPIGILTSLVGIPIFIFVLRNSKKGLQ